MKNKVLLLTTFVLLVTTFFSCSKDKEDPVGYVILGPNEVFQTEVIEYEVIPAFDQPGTEWTWSVDGALLADLSADTKVASISFTTVPANDTVYINVTATTSEGVVSPVKVVKVTVESFCVLDLNNFIGAFSCDEAGYEIYPVNFAKHATLANTIVNNNFWDFAATGAVVYYTLSGDFLEEVTVPRQDFEFGDGYVGWVEGSGTYDGCTHTMTVVNTLYYEGVEYTIYHDFAPATKGTTYSNLLKKGAEYFSR